MIYSKDNLESCRAFPLPAYQDWHNKRSNLGFRTQSLSLAGTPSAPLYTSVMVKRDPPFAGQSFPRLSLAELEGKIPEMAKQVPPLHLYILTATGPQATAVYAASFRRAKLAPVVKADLSADEFALENKARRDAGDILISVDAFGTPDKIRYCALWSVNSAKRAWGADGVNDMGKPLQQRKDAMAAMRARPTLVALTPAGGLAALYVDDWLQRSWSMPPAMSEAELKSHAETEEAAGRFPVQIGTATVDGAVRFAAIFAGGDEVVQRGKVQPRGTSLPGLSAASR